MVYHFWFAGSAQERSYAAIHTLFLKQLLLLAAPPHLLAQGYLQFFTNYQTGDSLRGEKKPQTINCCSVSDAEWRRMFECKSCSAFLLHSGEMISPELF